MRPKTLWRESRIMEAEDRIHEVEDRIVEINESEKKKEKLIKRNEDNLRNLQDNIKRYNIRIIGVPGTHISTGPELLNHTLDPVHHFHPHLLLLWSWRHIFIKITDFFMQTEEKKQRS